MTAYRRESCRGSPQQGRAPGAHQRERHDPDDNLEQDGSDVSQSQRHRRSNEANKGIQEERRGHTY